MQCFAENRNYQQLDTSEHKLYGTSYIKPLPLYIFYDTFLNAVLQCMTVETDAVQGEISLIIKNASDLCAVTLS